jgi:hypothetical protein
MSKTLLIRKAASRGMNKHASTLKQINTKGLTSRRITNAHNLPVAQPIYNNAIMAHAKLARPMHKSIIVTRIFQTNSSNKIQ